MSTATRARAFGVVVAFVLVVAGTAMGATYVISPDGLGDYPTIQAAVNAATDGDIIELTDGTFTLSVYDIAGRLVRRIVDGAVERGRHTLEWDGADEGGNQVAPGVYFVRLEVGERSAVRKMVVLR